MATTIDGRIVRDHGDVTGRRYDAQAQAAGDRLVAITHTTNALHEDAIRIFPEKGGAPWAIPTHFLELLRAHFERGTL